MYGVRKTVRNIVKVVKVVKVVRRFGQKEGLRTTLIEEEVSRKRKEQDFVVTASVWKFDADYNLAMCGPYIHNLALSQFLKI